MVNFFPAADLQAVASPMPPPSSLRGFEVDYTVSRMLDQPALWWQAVGLFIQHFADWESQWQAAQGKPADELKTVHALRSAAANVGAHQLSCVAGVLEELLNKTIAGQAKTPIPPSVRYYLEDCYRDVWRTATDAYFGPHGYPGPAPA